MSQVAAAIALVAEGRYRRVAVVGIPDALRLADALRADADACGVDLVVEAGADGVPQDVVVQRR